jgi:lipopolysaccharide/colanic/teichoic acid biosynthesis glycosyltransferase
MNDARDAHGELLPDAVRTTPIGRVIRRCSFDELLQLLNVLKGDMSLIGPRPLLIEYLDHYSPFQHRRHEVRPGITGLAQVKGRNQLSWERRFRYDVFYVDHLSLSFDLYIIWETVKTVIAGNDTEFPSTLTCTRFSGSSYARRAVRATAQGE